MAFFQIGSLEVEIQVQGPSVTREPVGPVFDTYGGRIRSQVRAIRRTWQGQTPPLTFTDADLVVATVGLGMNTVGGDWPGATVPVYIEILNDVPIKDDGEATGAQRILTIKARESIE